MNSKCTDNNALGCNSLTAEVSKAIIAIARSPPCSKSQPEEAPEKIKRLTLDIPKSLHRAIKKKAVEDGETMADQLRSLLEEHYRNL